jgi:hypothetical protein
VEQFEQVKHLFVPQLLRNPLRHAVYSYAMRKSLRGSMSPDDGQVPGTPSFYGDNLMEVLLHQLRPDMERLTGAQLYPTYSYFRVYKHGDVLEAHTDRPSCEISLSLTLGFEADAPWPLVLEIDNRPKPVSMMPGDGVVFRGMELKHWRERFAGVSHASVFLHYVRRSGPFAEWRDDKRNTRRAQAGRFVARAGGGMLRVLNSTTLAARKHALE